MTIEHLLQKISDLQDRKARGGAVSEDELAEVRQQVENLKSHRGGSRFAGQGADRETVAAIAAGGSVQGGQLVPGDGGDPSDKQVSGGSLAATYKALAEATPSAGGYLVQPEIASQITSLIRARSAVMQMLPQITPVKKELLINALSTGAAAYYVAENAAIPVSEETFSQDVLLQPKELAALVPVSNRLLRDAAQNPDLEQTLRTDLAEVMALRQDLAFLQGTGSGGEPTGIINKSGLTPAPSLGTNGGSASFDNLKDLVANLRAVNAPFNRPGWIFNGRLLNSLEKLKDGQGRYLADAGLLTFDPTGAGGTLLGYPFRTTGQIPTNLTRGSSTDTTYVLFSSDWNECWIGENEQLTIETSNAANYSTDGGTSWVSAFQNRQTLFRAVSAHDIGLRRPQFFSVMMGVRA